MKTKADLLREWYNRVGTSQKAHHYSADYFERCSVRFGIPVIVLTTLVGTSAFADFQTVYPPYGKIVAGLASIAAAVLAGLQTFLRQADRAEKHRVAASKYGTLGRRLETHRVASTPPTDEIIDELRTQIDALAEQSLQPPIAQYRRAWANWERYNPPESESDERST